MRRAILALALPAAALLAGCQKSEQQQIMAEEVPAGRVEQSPQRLMMFMTPEQRQVELDKQKLVRLGR